MRPPMSDSSPNHPSSNRPPSNHQSPNGQSSNGQSVNRERRLVLSAGAGAAAAALATVADAAKSPPARPSGAATQAPKARFDGRVAVITGATSGMGADATRAFAAQGGKVMFCGRRAEEGRMVEESVRASGGEATFFQADVTNEAQMKAFVDACGRKYGRLDYAFNNVGGAPGMAPIHQISTQDFESTLSSNLRGNYFPLKYEVPLMLESGGGSIVFNASIAGIRFLAGKAHYTMVKHGLIGLACAAALDYAKQNIRVNVVAPGLIKTEGAMRALGGDEHMFDYRIPMGAIGQSPDVTAAVLWLFSDESRYVTGAVLPVDGGQSVL